LAQVLPFIILLLDFLLMIDDDEANEANYNRINNHQHDTEELDYSKNCPDKWGLVLGQWCYFSIYEKRTNTEINKE
jgi:hypothetical protein